MPSLILRLCESPLKILTVPKDSQLKWTLRHVEATPKGPSFARETTRFLRPWQAFMLEQLWSETVARKLLVEFANSRQ